MRNASAAASNSAAAPSESMSVRVRRRVGLEEACACLVRVLGERLDGAVRGVVALLDDRGRLETSRLGELPHERVGLRELCVCLLNALERAAILGLGRDLLELRKRLLVRLVV